MDYLTYLASIAGMCSYSAHDMQAAASVTDLGLAYNCHIDTVDMAAEIFRPDENDAPFS